jgi:glycosyltransferase involved in cell wall biosynthesis
MKLRRILLVSEPGISGVFLIVRQLIHFLHRVHPEISVDLAYSSRRTWPDFPALVDAVRSHGGEAIDLRVGSRPEPRDAQAMLQLRRLVRRRSPQLVHAHSSKAGGLCRLLAWLPGFPPVLYTPHAYYGLARHGGAKEMFYNRMESFLGRSGLTQVLADDERRFARETLHLPARSLVLINTGIPADQFVPADDAQKAAARDKLGIPREGKLLVTTGRDCAQKNYAPLYAALNHFMAGQPAFFFAHAGEGAVKRREAMDAARRARCFCFDHLADVRDLLWAADGFIMTSLYEGLSISMLEAFSCGLPLLLTEAPGFSRMRSCGGNIVWLPDPNHCADFEAEVLKALRVWSGRPTIPSWEQHEFTLRNFNTPVQFGKVFRAYQWLLKEA